MTRYLININNDCSHCMECVEVCQSGILTKNFIIIANMFMLKDFNNYFKAHAFECTYCKSCEDICEQGAIIITRPECEES